MSDIKRVEAAEMPHPMVRGYAVRHDDVVAFVVREDLTEQQVAAVIERISALLPAEVRDAAHQRSEPAAE